MEIAKNHNRWRRVMAACTCGLFAAVVLFARAVTLHFNHDENQFLAAGALIARHGLWPFRDYAFFHAPGQPMLLAILFKVTSQRLFVARLLSVAGAIGIAFLLFIAGAKRNLLIAAAAVLIFIFNPMTAYTASLAWNHSLPVLCTLAALLLVEKPTRWRVVAAGSCAGCAVMLRHSYPPVVVALAVYVAMNGSWRRVAEFLAGALMPMIPTVFTPLRQVWFGLFVYPGLSRKYWAMQAIHLPRTFGEKLKYLAHANFAVGPATLLITAVVLVACRFNRRVAGTLLVIGALLIGILAPTPMMQQYPFPLVPFLVLLIVYAIECSPRCAFAIVIPVIGALWSARLDVQAMQTLVNPSAWVPVQIHRVAQRIPKDTPAPIYTLAPLFPVEADMDFDPACASGPFAWRIAPQLSQEERARFGIIGQDDWWKRDIGTVIMGDRNVDDIAASATAHGFHKVHDERAYSVWVK